MATNRREYQREYMKRRYRSDAQFRRKLLDTSMAWVKKNKEWRNKYLRERYLKRKEKNER